MLERKGGVTDNHSLELRISVMSPFLSVFPADELVQLVVRVVDDQIRIVAERRVVRDGRQPVAVKLREKGRSTRSRLELSKSYKSAQTPTLFPLGNTPIGLQNFVISGPQSGYTNFAGSLYRPPKNNPLGFAERTPIRLKTENRHKSGRSDNFWATTLSHEDSSAALLINVLLVFELFKF